MTYIHISRVSIVLYSLNHLTVILYVYFAPHLYRQSCVDLVYIDICFAKHAFSLSTLTNKPIQPLEIVTSFPMSFSCVYSRRIKNLCENVPVPQAKKEL